TLAPCLSPYPTLFRSVTSAPAPAFSVRLTPSAPTAAVIPPTPASLIRVITSWIVSAPVRSTVAVVVPLLSWNAPRCTPEPLAPRSEGHTSELQSPDHP